MPVFPPVFSIVEVNPVISSEVMYDFCKTRTLYLRTYCHIATRTHQSYVRAKSTYCSRVRLVRMVPYWYGTYSACVRTIWLTSSPDVIEPHQKTLSGISEELWQYHISK